MQTDTHPTIYRLNDNVMTTNGPASFIGYMREGHEVQVSVKRGNGCKNIIIPIGDITGLITDKKQASTAKAKTQAENTETGQGLAATNPA